MAEHPIVVAGAGPAGAMVALLLARQGRPVVLVDRPRAGRTVGEHLPATARPLLQRLGLVDTLEGHEVCVGQASVWQGVRSERSSISDPLGPGTLLDRHRFDEALRHHAQKAGAVWVDGRVRDVTAKGPLVEVTGAWEGLAAGIVDATGRSAHLARQLGGVLEAPSRSIAWCRWQRDAHPDRRLWVEDTDDGWFYTAPLPAGERVVVWHRQPSTRVSAQAFDEALSRASAVQERLGGRWLEGPVGRPAGGQRLQTSAGPGWWAVGDASMAFDPISSQGLITALSGAEQLVSAWSAETPDRHLAWCDRVWARYTKERARLGA